MDPDPDPSIIMQKLNDVNVPSKSNNQKKIVLKIIRRSMTTIGGSGSTSQKHGSEDLDPDPPQNVMDSEH